MRENMKEPENTAEASWSVKNSISPPQRRYEGGNGEYWQTKGRDDEIHQETLQETSDGRSIFQTDLEQPRENMGILGTSDKV